MSMAAFWVMGLSGFGALVVLKKLLSAGTLSQPARLFSCGAIPGRAVRGGWGGRVMEMKLARELLLGMGTRGKIEYKREEIE
jgi:hypothetical protein